MTTPRGSGTSPPRSQRRPLASCAGTRARSLRSRSAATADGSSRGAKTTPRALGPHRQAAGEDRALLSGHEGPVDAVAVSGDGRWLVTGSWDQTARLWDLTAKEPEKTARVLRGHAGPVFAVGFSGDGRWLVTGSGDKTVRLWPLKIEEILEQAGRALGRNFTR